MSLPDAVLRRAVDAGSPRQEEVGDGPVSAHTALVEGGVAGVVPDIHVLSARLYTVEGDLLYAKYNTLYLQHGWSSKGIT